MTSVLELNNPSTHERKAVLYARVSSKEQEKEGFSIPSQLKLLREYGSTEGVRIAQEYVDVETAKLAGRANFGAMVTHLKANLSIRTLLVEKTDRLCRNLKDWVTLDELDVEIHFVKEFVRSFVSRVAAKSGAKPKRHRTASKCRSVVSRRGRRACRTSKECSETLREAGSKGEAAPSRIPSIELLLEE